jgi:hypothetical protein
LTDKRLHYKTQSYCTFCGEWRDKDRTCSICGMLMRQSPRNPKYKGEKKRY